MAWEPYFNFIQAQEILTENSQEKKWKRKKKKTSITMLAISMRQSRGYPRDWLDYAQRSRTVVTLWQT